MKRFLLLTVALSISGAAYADEVLKFRTIVHAAEPPRVHQIGDVDGHRVLLVHNLGTVTFSDGSTGTTDHVSAADYIKASAYFPLNYVNVTAADGSVLWLKGPANATPKNGRTAIKGTVTVIGGSGRFAGMKGDGTAIGERPEAGIAGEAIIDFVINLNASQGTADEAKAMLMKAVAAIKADPNIALAMFNKGEGGFRDRDLCPFCNRMSDGKAIATPVAVRSGTDLRTLKDPAGKIIGEDIYEAELRVPEGQIAEVRYLFPKPGTTAPSVPKVAFVTRVGDLGCGVGYYPN
jgi:hypothetical protein